MIVRGRLVSGLALGVFALLWAIASPACSSRRTGADDLVPEDTIVTVALDWLEIRRDARLTALVGGLPPNVMEWGANDAGLRRVTMFGRLGERTSVRPALILEGKDVGRGISGRRGPAARGERRGALTFFRHPERDEGALVVSNNVAVVGSLGDIAAVQERVSARRTTGRRATELQGLRSGSRTPAVALTVVWPDDVRLAVEGAVELSSGLMGLFGWEPLSGLLSRLGIGRAILATVSPAQGGLSLHVTARLSDEATSRSIAAALSAVQSLSRLAGSQAPAFRLPDMDVSAYGPIVSVRAFIPNEALPSLSR